MNTIVQSLVLAHAEQTTVQATVGCINDGAKPEGNARPDSNYSKRTMNMRIIHGKMRIRSPECDIKYLERLSETFIGALSNVSWPVLVCGYRCGSRFKIPVKDLSKNNRRIPVCDHSIRIIKNY